ncbi:C13 family peptidase [uncultured Brevundimonas sp.]|uniref:C13 family peptidase n=1 Tax=uncultured Brevundimonas sp. TaxID=213418 RepID=UPI00263372C5|nr:C13 family peptidase [uncultured Brevundimonas sp.]
MRGWSSKLKKLALVVLAVVFPAGVGTDAAAQTRFDGWASVVVAGDWRDGSGKPIEAFDNARRDLSRSILNAGLPQSLHASVTLNPAKPDKLSPTDAVKTIEATLTQGARGCLFYFTSHGSPGNLTFGDTRGLSPTDMAVFLRRWCEGKPTVLVLSACYSGSFVDALRAPNRMILTAARRDRSSFGCGEGETYPWFDACFLESLPDATDFLDAANRTRRCVATRESAAEITLPSEPQMFIGAEMQIRLPTLRFASRQ